METKKFDPAKLARLNNPDRLKNISFEEIFKEYHLNPETVVDLGAGTALFSRALSELLPEAKIWACDTSPVMVDWMKEHILQDYPQISVLQSLENSVPLPDETADLLFMVNLHHELEDPAALLKEAGRILKKGGIIAISDWKKEETPMGPPLKIRVDEGTVESQLKSAGFIETAVKKTSGYNYQITARKALT